jgi:hypothetical protein
MSSDRHGGLVAPRSVEDAESESLRRFRRGELSLDEYLDEQAEEAMAHVKGRVPADTLASIRFVLREKLRSDPVLIEMVRRTTGLVPWPIDDLGGN